MGNKWQFAQQDFDNATPDEDFERQDYIDKKKDELFTNGAIEVNGFKIDITSVNERACHRDLTELLCKAAMGHECLDEIREAMQKAAGELIVEAMGDAE